MHFARNIVAHLFIGSCLLMLPLAAVDSSKKAIAKELNNGNDKRLCRLLRTNAKQNISLTALKALAVKQDAKSLVKAIDSTRKTKLKNLGISKAEFLAIAYFINTVANGKTTHYSKDKTGLSHVIEYDRDTKNYFIVLEGRGVYLDRGMKKTVSKALQYKNSGAVVVARGEQSIEMDKELEITKEFRGRPGLFRSLGICHHTENDLQYHTIYSKLYSPGSLQNVFHNDYKLSLYEKIRIAHRISRGLRTLHKKGVVHRDLGIKNYLINIPKGKPGRRKIEACIADFGRAGRASQIVPEPRVQGNTTYMAPEGHFYKKLTKNSYTRLDVFAMGCVFYRLLHGQKGAWQNKNYVMKDTRPVPMRHQEHKNLVTTGTALRRITLAREKNRSARSEFEYLVLRMLHTNPKKRPSATTVHNKLDEIFNRYKSSKKTA